ncbi:MAG: hypothetical protein H5T92_00205 [Synergistales bacterium]|nr:hypothetical protein [Synergistales bacterium]
MSFDKPLDQDIVETREVVRREMVPDGTNPDGTPRFKIQTVKESVEEVVRYTKAPKKHFGCGDGKHVWEMIDRHRHIAKCKNCPKHRFLRAVYERIDEEGHIRDRETDTIID